MGDPSIRCWVLIAFTGAIADICPTKMPPSLAPKAILAAGGKVHWSSATCW